MSQTVLVTGFAPFGGETINPSWEAVRRLPCQIDDYRIETLCLPVEFGVAARLSWEKALKIEAGAILGVGQAGGRGAITPEVIGINLRDGGSADNAGAAFVNTRIFPDAPDGIFSTVNVRAMAESMKSAGIKTALSYWAGNYVCNDLLFSLLHRATCEKTAMKVGFVHLPYLPEQAKNGAPSLSLDEMVKGLTICIQNL